MVLDWQVQAADASGRVWKVVGDWLPRRLVIRPGAETRLVLAAPLQAHVFIYPESDPVSFRARFTGPNGERVTAITVDGVKPPLPWLKVRDTEGKEVQSLPFQPG
jgi:hypothetical protein